MTMTFKFAPLKRYLKKFPLLVRIRKAISRLIRVYKPASIFTDREFFLKQFSKSPNIKSLSFERGVVTGHFRTTPFILRIRPQNFIESHVYLNGIWEPHIAELIASYLNEPNVTVIDIGANIGATSIPLAKHFPNVSFLLFEPHPIVYQDLIDNLNFNKVSNIKAENIAITDNTQHSLPFYAQKDAKNFGLSSFTLNHDIQDYDVIQVQCNSLDEVVDENLMIRVIKIDTQGHELNVLLSAKNVISKCRPIIFFEFESEYFENKTLEEQTKRSILNFFSSLRYELYMLSHDKKFSPEITLKEYFHGDILALPLRSDT